MNLPIKTYPDKILRQNATKISDFSDAKLAELISGMKETMLKNDGLGLAAPQVGKSIRLIVVNTKDGARALLNPTTITMTLKKDIMEEGCLSLPGVFGLVKRWKKIKVTAYDEKGKKTVFTAKGLLARVILHEIDHLNGILFIDKAEKITVGREKLNNL